MGSTGYGVKEQHAQAMAGAELLPRLGLPALPGTSTSELPTNTLGYGLHC